MTPKEKAKELIEKFILFSTVYDNGRVVNTRNPQQCALIAVEEILDAYRDANVEYEDGKHTKYWTEVKQEIEKL